VTQRYLSLFSGAGGFDLGLLRAGLQPGLMVDESPAACGVLRAAMPTASVMQADVHDVLNAGTISALAKTALTGTAWAQLVAGQPPLLKEGRHDPLVNPDGDAPQLLYRFLDAVGQAGAPAFVMALVPALSGKRWEPVMTRLRATARVFGYDTYAPVLDAADYGVPQHRARLFLIGLPRGCKPDSGAVAHRPKVSAGEALRALDEKAPRDIPCQAVIALAWRPVLRGSPYSSELLHGGARFLDLNRVAPELPGDLGGTRTPVIDIAQLESGASPWAEAYHARLWRDRMSPLEQLPPGTRLARLSLRQCAALQGLPPDYPLRGSPLAQFKLTGKTMPPALAEAAARMTLAGLSS
jgi:DNA (cytosine-5)-methyltransferase 1